MNNASRPIVGEGTATPEDAAEYFRAHKMTQEEARADNLLNEQDTNRNTTNGYWIGTYAGDNLYANFRDGDISANKAAAIAEVAQGNLALEDAGLKMKHMPAAQMRSALSLLKQSLERQGENPEGKEQLLFDGLFNDDAIKLAERQSRVAATHIGDLRRKVKLAEAAEKLSRDKLNVKEVSKQLGVTVKSHADVKRQLESFRQELNRWELNRWEHYDTDAELIGQINDELDGVQPKEKPAEKPQPKQEAPKTEALKAPVAKEPTPPANPAAQEVAEKNEPSTQALPEEQIDTNNDDNFPDTDEGYLARVRSWLTSANVNYAKGKSLQDIINVFGNKLLPIARIPMDYLASLNSTIQDNRVYSGKGYLIDHAANHHPEVALKQYERLQYFIDNADEVRLDNTNANRAPSLLFIKKLGDNGVVVVSFDRNENNKVVLHKTFFDSFKKNRFNKFPLVQKPLVGGSSTISQTDQTVSGSHQVSALNGSETNVAQETEIASEPAQTPQNNSEISKGDTKQEAAPGDAKSAQAGESVTAERILPVLLAPGGQVSLVATNASGEGIVVKKTRPRLVTFFIPQKLLRQKNSPFGPVIDQDNLLGRREAPVKGRDRFSRFLADQADEDALRRALEVIEKNYGLSLRTAVDEAAETTHTKGAISDEGADTKFSYVPAGEVLERLENEPTVKVYRAMQLVDGKLYPPMAGKVDGDWQEPVILGRWMQADERPDLVKGGKFKLNKGNGSSITAAYNPYFHTSRSPLNDQFSSAYKRDNLVTVECEIPASELTSGYRAEGAKDAVGEMPWHSGPVSSRLAHQGQPRKVILSRYVKVNRIVPDAEVAGQVAKMLNGTDIAIPENVVTPSLRQELEKQGVNIAGKGTQFSYRRDDNKKTPSGDTLLAQANQKFNNELDKYDQLDSGHVFRLGLPGQLLQDYGFSENPLELSRRVVEQKANESGASIYTLGSQEFAFRNSETFGHFQIF